MRTCGHDINGVELAVAGQPVTMYRCAICDRTYWQRDGEAVSVEDVTAALRDETDAKMQRRAARAAGRR